MSFKTEEQYKLRISELQKEIESLKQKLTSKIKSERYGLSWIDVPEAFDKESENKIPVLSEVKEKSIKNKDGKPTHILIEGDNYHALTCLNYTHAGKIDVIYIDPPYNTGSDGFTYKDARFLKEYPDGTPVPKDHPLRHSYWISFMAKRLKLAYNLLSDTGVIFISIDDNEQANLKLLCDKIFGENSFVTIIHVEMSATQGMKVKAAQMGNIVKNAEYILVYSKDGHKNIAKKLLYDYRPEYDNHYSYILSDDKCSFKSLSKVFYEIYPEEKKKDIVDLYAESPMFKAFVDSNIKSIFRFDKTTGFSIEDFEKEKIYYQVEYNNRIYSLYNNGKEINQLMFLSDSFGPCNDFNHSIGLRKIRGDWWKDFYKDMGNVSKEGNVEYKNGKKPLRLIQQIIKMSSTSHSTILDFFGGSATTAHATILENLEDNGARQFIICQSQEKEKICENKTYRRIYNSMQGYYLDSGKQVTGLGNSLKYYRTDFVGKHTAHLANDEDRVLLAQKAGCLISLCENTLEEIETTKYYQIFTDGKRFTGVYFSDDTEQLPEFVGEIESKDALTAVYIFCWGSPDIYENEFNDLKKITIKAIPQSILEIYKTIYSGEE